MTIRKSLLCYIIATAAASSLSGQPVAITDSATGVACSGAFLHGIIMANGSPTTVSFQYGPTVAYGSNYDLPDPLTGFNVTPLTVWLSSVLPYTTYHFRIVGTNPYGTAFGDDKTFYTGATLPAVYTVAATAVAGTWANLNGVVKPNCDPTSCWFEYGTTTAYGTTTPAVPSNISGSTTINILSIVGGLIPNTTWHFKACASNSFGTACGNDWTFYTGCAVAGAAGPVTGPSSVCQGGTGYGYSIAPLTGATSYVWSVPAGASIVTGSSSYSITVNYGAAAASGIVSVYGIAPCGSGPASQLAVTVNPVPAPALSGPASACLNSQGNMYLTQPGMPVYFWNVSPGGVITAGGTSTSSSVTVSWVTPGTKTVSVNYGNASGCAAYSPTVLNVVVSAYAQPAVSGPQNICEGTQGSVYATEAGMTGYNWSVSPGGAITAGAGTSSITVTWITPGAQSVSLNYTNGSGCTAASPVVYQVSVIPAVHPFILGSDNPCVSSGYSTYVTQQNYLMYQWAVSPGGTIVYGQGTSIAEVLWTMPGPQWISVTFTVGGSGCSPLTPTVFPVTVNPLPGAAGAITGTPNTCAGTSGLTYSVAPVASALSYVWTLPPGAVLSSGAWSNTITVDFPANSSSGNMTVYGNNLCGNGTVSSPYFVTVTQLPGPSGAISGPDSVCRGTAGASYSISPVANATGYQWNVPPGSSITAGAGTSQVTVDFSQAASTGNVGVSAFNSCGQGAASPGFIVTVKPEPQPPVISLQNDTLFSNAPGGNQWFRNSVPLPGATGQSYFPNQQPGTYWDIVTLDGCSSSPSNNILLVPVSLQKRDEQEFSIFPNPNNGIFTIRASPFMASPVRIMVVNSLGLTVRVLSFHNGSTEAVNSFDLSSSPDGVYTLIITGNNSLVVRRLVIRK
ncbi:MAG: T9SS type A sorting domain-containing protein [Bacteroidota bacterium]